MGEYQSHYCENLAKRIFLDTLDECIYFPKYLVIETCNNCNAQCIMCPKGRKGTNSIQLMEDVLFDKIVEEVKAYKHWIEMICLNSDGEPLLDKKIAHRIKKLKDIGIKHIQISTNAQLLSEGRIRELLESGLDDIRISIDGYTKDTYEKIRRGLNYDTVKENVLNVIKIRDKVRSKMNIRIRLVEMEENKGELEAWMNYWNLQVREGDRVQVMPMHTWSGNIADATEEQKQYYADKPCVSVFSTLVINYDGIVQLCDSDIEQRVVMGNVKDNTIQKIWQGEKFVYIRNCHANAKRNDIEICRGCDHWSRVYKEGRI